MKAAPKLTPEARNRQISQVTEDHGFLDAIVTTMLRQAPTERPPSRIAEVKMLIQRHKSEAVSLQRLSQIEGTVIKTTEIDSLWQSRRRDSLAPIGMADCLR